VLTYPLEMTAAILGIVGGTILLVLSVGQVQSHGLILDPMARNWIWNNPAFPDQPPMWNAQGVWCGPPEGMGFPDTWYLPQGPSMSTCGRCGDDIGQAVPRDHEMGGKYGRGHIAKTYTAGSTIDVTIRMGAPHGGYFYFELCPTGIETDNCFQSLQIVGGSSQIQPHGMCVIENENPGLDYVARVKLPDNVRCTRCTLRWTYRTSYYQPDPCYNPNEAQTFRNCADIAIV